MPDGLTLFKVGATGYVANNFLSGWSDPSQTVLPGEGCLILNPTPSSVNVRFKGEVLQGTLVNHLSSGLSMCGSIAAQSGLLQTQLAYPAQDGDRVLIFNSAAHGYQLYISDFGFWSETEPILNVGRR